MGLPETIAVFMGQYAITRAAVDPAVDAALDVIRDRVSGVIDRAREKAGDRELDAGERTAWAVFDTAWKNDDSIVADYLGGILAAASEDDTGVPIAAQIARLSSLDLRLHFALYRTYQPFISITVGVDRPEAMSHPDLYVSKTNLLHACGLPHDAPGIVRLEQGLRNLGRERLIGQVLHNGFDGSPSEPFLFSDAEIRRWFKREPPEPGVVFAPSNDGMSLLAWGVGLADPSPLGYRDCDIPDAVGEIELAECGSATPVLELPETGDGSGAGSRSGAGFGDGTGSGAPLAGPQRRSP
jgi:hypothetical protein